MASKQNSKVPPDMAVGFIGAGRMAQAMARGFISAGIIQAGNITASDTDPRMLNYMKKENVYSIVDYLSEALSGRQLSLFQCMKYTHTATATQKFVSRLLPEMDLGVNVTESNKEVVQKSRMIVLAVKPNVVSPVLQEVSNTVSKEKLVVSIAAGIPIADIEKLLPEGSKVIRVMPNTPALVQAAASVLAPGRAVDDNDTELVIELLRCFGIAEPGSEKLLDAVTGLSGSGPAYAFTAIEALSDGGVKMGLPRDLATKLAAQTLLGAAKMVLETGKHPGQLKDEVCSPGGTTIAAMHKLERGGFRASLIDAVEAATLRAKELGQPK